MGAGRTAAVAGGRGDTLHRQPNRRACPSPNHTRTTSAPTPKRECRTKVERSLADAQGKQDGLRRKLGEIQAKAAAAAGGSGGASGGGQ